MSELSFQFYPDGKLGELFLYMQKWAAENNLGTTPVLFKAYLATAQSISNATATKISWDTEVYDYSNNFDLDTNKRFVVPEDGVCMLIACVGISALADGSRLSISLYKNGSSFIAGSSVANGAAATARSIVSVPAYLTKNDYIEVYCEHNHGSARNTSTGEDEIYFAAYRISNIT